MALTTVQLQALKSAIATETDPVFVTLRATNDESGMAAWYNLTSTFVAWKSKVTLLETGQAFNGTEWAGMTSANHTRLTDVALWISSGYDAAKADIRAMFNDIWSGAGGTNTRANLLTLWKRFATRGEKIYCTGAGSDASPGIFTFEGVLTAQDISDALRA